MHSSRRRFLQAAAAFAALSAAGCGRNHLPAYAPASSHVAPPAISGSLRLLVLGDWGSGQIEQWQVAQGMETLAASLKGFHAGLMLGDNFYPGGVSSIDDPLWSQYFEQVYDTPHLGQLHWHALLGNHDHAGSVRAQFEYTRKNPRWHMPWFFWSHTFHSASGPLVKVVAIDTNRKFGQWAAQMHFLDRELECSPDLPVVVCGHHPIYTCGKLGALPRVKYELRDKLVRAGVKAYISGHEHNQQLIVRDGLTQLVQGGGGKVLTPLVWKQQAKGVVFGAEEYGFSVLYADAQGLRFDWRDRTGKLLHEHTL
ncbi:MAG: metallophosphoesterase [Planctomycetes bacterium]|nr:metallophosphoesterase [Planctomycetota bacterium]